MARMKSVAAALLVTLAPLTAASLFDVQTFDQPHTWQSGNPDPNPPVLLPDGGPLGPGDTALRISSSGGVGPGSRLVAYTTSDFTGDFTSAGVTGLALDLRNAGSTNLNIHIALNGPGGWFVTPGQAVNRFAPWNAYEFALTRDALNSGGGTDVDATLASVTQVRILHSTSADQFRADPISAQLLVDNIRAVPEPHLLGLLSLASLTRSRRKR